MSRMKILSPFAARSATSFKTGASSRTELSLTILRPFQFSKVGLDPSMAKRYPAQLSGGQRQRVGVARALANRADILLMDEPFGALDPLVRADLQRQLRRIQKSLGTTILFVTHDIDEAILLGDRIVLLREGAQIAQEGTPRDLLLNPANDFVREFLGTSAISERERILEGAPDGSQAGKSGTASANVVQGERA